MRGWAPRPKWALVLGGNRLTAVPEWVGNLTALTTLSLGGSPLTAVHGTAHSTYATRGAGTVQRTVPRRLQTASKIVTA